MKFEETKTAREARNVDLAAVIGQSPRSEIHSIRVELTCPNCNGVDFEEAGGSFYCCGHQIGTGEALAAALRGEPLGAIGGFRMVTALDSAGKAFRSEMVAYHKDSDEERRAIFNAR